MTDDALTTCPCCQGARFWSSSVVCQVCSAEGIVPTAFVIECSLLGLDLDLVYLPAKDLLAIALTMERHGMSTARLRYRMHEVSRLLARHGRPHRDP